MINGYYQTYSLTIVISTSHSLTDVLVSVVPISGLRVIRCKYFMVLSVYHTVPLYNVSNDHASLFFITRKLPLLPL